jgi:hypothetical protein
MKKNRVFSSPSHSYLVQRELSRFPLAPQKAAEQPSTISKSLRLPPTSASLSNEPTTAFHHLTHKSNAPIPASPPSATNLPPQPIHQCNLTAARADPTQALPRTGQALLIPSAGPANHPAPRGEHGRVMMRACAERALLIYGRGRVCMIFSPSPGFVF